MPNIVHNTLEISFEAEDDMSSFRKMIKVHEHENMEGHLALAESLYPIPEDCEDRYHWTIANYGGKWGDWYTEELVNYRENKVTYRFDSAWAPLVTLVSRINEDYKVDIDFKHFSIENMQEGQLILSKEGKVVKDWCRDLDYDELFMEDVVD